MAATKSSPEVEGFAEDTEEPVTSAVTSLSPVKHEKFDRTDRLAARCFRPP